MEDDPDRARREGDRRRRRAGERIGPAGIGRPDRDVRDDPIRRRVDRVPSRVDVGGPDRPFAGRDVLAEGERRRRKPIDVCGHLPGRGVVPVEVVPGSGADPVRAEAERSADRRAVQRKCLDRVQASRSVQGRRRGIRRRRCWRRRRWGWWMLVQLPQAARLAMEAVSPGRRSNRFLQRSPARRQRRLPPMRAATDPLWHEPAAAEAFSAALPDDWAGAD